MVTLSIIQFETLNFIQCFILKKGFPPTVKEMCINYGVAPRTIQDRIKILKKKGCIKSEPLKSRAIKILQEKLYVSIDGQEHFVSIDIDKGKNERMLKNKKVGNLETNKRRDVENDLKQFVEYINCYIMARGEAPTLWNIATWFDISYGTVQKRLEKLKKMELIETELKGKIKIRLVKETRIVDHKLFEILKLGAKK